MTIKRNSEYLSNESPILLYPALARAFGTEKAAIIQQVRFWTSHYERTESLLDADKRKHYHDGRWWVYNTYKDWETSNFDWIPEATLRRYINQLENVKVLIAGEYNRFDGDRTKWYTIDYDVLDKTIHANERKWTEKKRLRRAERQQRYANRAPSDQTEQMSTNGDDPYDQADQMGDQTDRLIPETTTEKALTDSAAGKPASKAKLDVQGRAINNKHPEWQGFWDAVLIVRGVSVDQLTNSMKANIAKVVTEVIQPCTYEPADVLYFPEFANEKDWHDWTVNAIPTRIADVRAMRLNTHKPRPIAAPQPYDDTLPLWQQSSENQELARQKIAEYRRARSVQPKESDPS